MARKGLVYLNQASLHGNVLVEQIRSRFSWNFWRLYTCCAWSRLIGTWSLGTISTHIDRRICVELSPGILFLEYGCAIRALWASTFHPMITGHIMHLPQDSKSILQPALVVDIVPRAPPCRFTAAHTAGRPRLDPQLAKVPIGYQFTLLARDSGNRTEQLISNDESSLFIHELICHVLLLRADHAAMDPTAR